uniref:Uncharacterized protein n=1 Tax=Arundo donax TaxID=35708 RepID=A0A0A9A7Z1_ARUDO
MIDQAQFETLQLHQIASCFAKSIHRLIYQHICLLVLQIWML